MKSQIIQSRANPRYKHLKQLAQAGFGSDLIVVEGLKLIREAMAAGVSFESVWEIEADALNIACPRFRLGAEMYRQASPTRSGNAPLAVVRCPSLNRGEMPAPGRVLLLDAVQEPGNAGALVRAAAAFGFSAVVWLKPCVFPFHHACIRASAGTVFQVKHYLWEDAGPLASAEMPVFGADGHGEVGLKDVTWPQHLVLAMGNEGHGLRAEVKAHLTQRVAIPIAPGVESLNVAGAAHILMYHIAERHL